MRLDRLTVAGFMRFPEPATLDLQALPPGLVAITGSNGEGKTRLLDGAFGALYGEFPSRSGSLASFTTDRAAYLEAQFTIEGRGTFRARFTCDGVSRASKAVLEDITDPEHPYLLNDGKVTTFAEKVRELFPDKRVVLASAFASQDRSGSFVDLDRIGKKALFTKLLGLGQYAEMAQTAKACLAIVEAARVRLLERQALLSVETSQARRDSLATRSDELQAAYLRLETRRAELDPRFAALEAEVAGLVTQADAWQTADTRHKVLAMAIDRHQAALQQCDRDRQAAAQQCEAATAAADSAHARRLGEIDSHERAVMSTTSQRRIEMNAAIAAAEKTLAKADEIRGAVQESADATTQIAELRAAMEQAVTDHTAAAEQVRSRERRLDDVRKAQRELDAAEVAVKTLTVVKFGEACGEDTPCQFVVGAARAKASIPELEGEIAQGPHLQAGVDLWTERRDSYADVVRSKRTAIAQVEQRIRDLQPTVAQATELAAVEARIMAKREALDQLAVAEDAQDLDFQHQRSSAGGVRRAAIELADLQLRSRLAELQVLVDTESDALATANAEQVCLTWTLNEHAAAVARLSEARADLESVRKSSSAVQAEGAALDERRAAVYRERTTLSRQLYALEHVQRNLATVEQRYVVWQTCAQAFHLNGLPTLEIAAAGPTVSALLNDLLSSCFGSRFSCELVTQIETADGKALKEDFSLRITDQEHGGERDIAHLSGGERVIVEEALRAALALYVNQRSAAPIRTIVRDETTGSLDPENALRYVGMLRRLLDRGGFEKILFVCHNPDAADLADSHIYVTNGQPVVIRRAA